MGIIFKQILMFSIAGHQVHDAGLPMRMFPAGQDAVAPVPDVQTRMGPSR